jgi:phage terminase large subunit-like protein
MPRHPRHNSGKRQGWNDLSGYNRALSVPNRPTIRQPTDSEVATVNNPEAVEKYATALKMAMALKERQVKSKGEWTPLPIQICPKSDDDPSWDTWVLRGGRGSGKTEGGSRYVLNHLRKYGPKARVGVGAKTAADARDTCAEGDSGLITIAPDEFFYHRSVGEARHKKGGYVKFMGAEEPDRWNGPQWSLLWEDEAGLWPKATHDQAQLGLRLGDFPRTIITSTPKVAKWLKAIEDRPETVHTHGTLKENFHLSEFARKRLIETYTGTSLEKRELEGEWSFESENSLWTEELLAGCHVDLHPALARIVIAIDPAVTSGETADDTGIVAAGVDSFDKRYCRGYVLKDRTCHLSPLGWAEEAVRLYEELEADLIVAETNNGGDLVETTIRAINPSIPFKKVHASRGKAIRAQPIVSLYEKGRVFHVSHSRNSLVELEQEMLSWDPTGYKSPNRMDAVVWALTELMIDATDRKQIYRVVYNDPVRISAY